MSASSSELSEERRVALNITEDRLTLLSKSKNEFQLQSLPYKFDSYVEHRGKCSEGYHFNEFIGFIYNYRSSLHLSKKYEINLTFRSFLGPPNVKSKS